MARITRVRSKVDESKPRNKDVIDRKQACGEDQIDLENKHYGATMNTWKYSNSHGRNQEDEGTTDGDECAATVEEMKIKRGLGKSREHPSRSHLRRGSLGVTREMKLNTRASPQSRRYGMNGRRMSKPGRHSFREYPTRGYFGRF